MCAEKLKTSLIYRTETRN